MGADSRTSTGSYIANRVSDKITQISDHIFCCRSGSAADTQAISDIVKNLIAQHSITNGEEATVEVAANIFKSFCYEYIYGFCDAEYREGMNREECCTFVTRALSLAMGRDGS